MVGRSAMLIAWSSIFIALVIYIDGSREILSYPWERALFSVIAGLAIVATLNLMASWTQRMPLDDVLGEREHVYFMIRFYIKRMRAFNVAELVLRVSCAIVTAILAVHGCASLFGS